MHISFRLLALSFVFAGHAAAVDSTFSGSGAWDNSASWTPSGVPNGAGFNVTLPAGSNVSGLGVDVAVDSFTTGGNVNFVFGGSGKAVTVNNTFTHSSGTLTLQASMGLVIGENATAALTGTLALSNGAGVLNHGAMVFGAGTPSAVPFTPAASGFTAGAYTFRNDGVADFNAGTHLSLNNAVVLNTGLLTIDSGGSLLMTSYTQTEHGAVAVTTVKSGSTLRANQLKLTRGALYSAGIINGDSTTLAAFSCLRGMRPCRWAPSASREIRGKSAAPPGISTSEASPRARSTTTSPRGRI